MSTSTPREHITVNVRADCSELDKVIQKALHLEQILKEAKSLADDLALHQVEIDLKFNV